jgi:hypothetical protein
MKLAGLEPATSWMRPPALGAHKPHGYAVSAPWGATAPPTFFEPVLHSGNDHPLSPGARVAPTPPDEASACSPMRV